MTFLHSFVVCLLALAKGVFDPKLSFWSVYFITKTSFTEAVQIFKTSVVVTPVNGIVRNKLMNSLQKFKMQNKSLRILFYNN